MNKILPTLFTILFLVGLGENALAQSDDRLAVLDTNLGIIVIDFFSDDAPQHVDNFVGLAESGFYDGTLFHRIIPKFMIQGGDPNTIDSDPRTWGTGDPGTTVDAEFNTIKHNRGIVSMARSADPNSGGSQFFIVHADSNFLDGQYTVFGRIVTLESFETLDKIAAVETGDKDIPTDPQQTRVNKITIVDRVDVYNLLELQEPERTTISPIANQRYENTEQNVEFSAPEGWILQTPDKTSPDVPDVIAVGPKAGDVTPVISLTIHETNQKTLNDIISEKDENIRSKIEEGSLQIISQQKTTIAGYDAYVTDAQGIFSSDGQDLDVQFRDIMIYDTEKFYVLTYSNGVDNFDSQLSEFEDTVESFEILTQDKPTEEGGGCLIATATFGSELAPQVQQLRELRDNTILSTESGAAFMSGFNQFYYSFSPAIADLERENPIFKQMVKISITPMLTSLSILNHAQINSETDMLTYGLGVILLNIGMYFVAPAIIIYKIKK